MGLIRFGILFLWFVGIGLSGYGQDRPIRFYTSLQVGIAQGEEHEGIVLQSTAGIQKEAWFGGLGIGYDSYAYRSLPLFLEIRKYFGEKQTTYFYGASGYNFPLSDKPESNFDYYASYNFYGGIYTNFGVGYWVPLSQKSGLLFNVGYSYKRTYADMYYNVCNSCTPVKPDRYTFSYGRLEFKTGIIF